MNLLTLTAFLAEEATETLPELVPVVTAYSDMKIPVLSSVFLVIGAVLLVAFAIFGFLFFRIRGSHWGFSMIYGMIASMVVYLLSVYLPNFAVSIAAQKVDSVRVFFEANHDAVSILVAILGILFQCLGVFIGIRTIFGSSEKRNITVDFVTPFVFGLGYFIGMVLVSNTLVYTMQYVMMITSINNMGFDMAVATLVQNGMAQEEAINTLLELVKQSPWNYLFDALSYMLTSLAVISGGILFYGARREKLTTLHAWLGALLIAAVNVPGFLTNVFDVPAYITLPLLILLTAGTAYTAYRITKKYMPEEFEVLKKTHAPGNSDQNGGSGSGMFGRKKEEPKKMPKIVMPND